MYKKDIPILSAVVALVYLSFVLNISSLLVIPLLLLIIRVFIHEIEMNIYLILFLLPNLRMFDSLGESYGVNIIIVLCLFKFIFIELRKIKTDVWLFAFIFIIIEFSHYFITHNQLILLNVISWISAFILASSCLIDETIKINKVPSFWYLALGTLFSAAAVFTSDSIFYTLRYIELDLRLIGLAGDPNILSLYILILIFSAVNLQKDSQFKWLYYFMFFILTLFGFATLSKMFTLTFFLVSIILVLYSVLYPKIETRKQQKFIMGVVGIAVIVIIFMYPFLENVFQGIFNRFFIDDFSQLSLENLDNLSSGRSSLVNFYLNQLTHNVVLLLFGYGHFYHVEFGLQLAHNTYLDIVLTWGVLGSTVFGTLLYLIYQEFRRITVKAKYLFAYFPMIAMLVAFVSLSIFEADMFFFVLFYVLIQTTKDEIIK